MHNESSQTHRCQQPQNDLMNTPEHLRPGFTGQPRQYDPREFGLTGNEEWQHPSMFRNMTYESHIGATDTFRQAQPRRTEFCPPLAHNLGNLPEEHLADMTPPTFELEATPLGANQSNSYVDSLYQDIMNRFDELRARIARGDNKVHPEGSRASCTPSTTPNEVSEVCTSQSKNGTQRTLRKVTTCRDQCGNVTTRVEETSTVSNGRPANADCAPTNQERQLNLSMDQSENLADESMPTFHDDSMPAMSTRIAPQGLPSECLGDTSAPPLSTPAENRAQTQGRPIHILSPSFGTNVCLEDISAPSLAQSTTSRSGCPAIQDICEISAPSLMSSSRGPMNSECMDNASFGGVSAASNRQMTNFPSECLEDVTAPSYGRDMSSSRSTRRQQRSMPSQNICDISAPSFGSSGRGQTTNQCLEDMSMPSFGGVSGATNARSPTRQQMSMPSQNICDISAPSFGNSGNEVSFGRSATNECLEDMSMPSFGGVSGATNARSPTRQQMSMPSQNICDISAPSFGNSGNEVSFGRSATNECLEDMSMPSFGGVSGATNARSPTRQQMSMPSQNICDISAPSFGNSGNEVSFGRSATNECLEDMSMPSFGGISGASRARSQRQQQQSMPSQNICDTSAPPSFQNTGRGPMTNECLENITMPTFGGVSGTSRQRTVTSECLEDRTQPSMGNNVAPQMTNECLENITMPSFGEVSGPSRRQQTLPSECLDNVTQPSFGRSMSRGQGQGQQDMSMTHQNVYNNQPYYVGQRTMPSECLADVSAPSFGRSMSPSRSAGRQQRSMPAQNISCITPPSFENSSREVSTQSCLEDMSMPSFEGVSGASRTRSPNRQQRLMPTQNICDTSAPSFQNSGRGAMANECSNNMTMPSFGGVPGSSRRQRTMPSECLDNVTQPSFGRSMPSQNTYEMSQECYDNATMPSSGFSNRQRTNFPSECLDDVTAPSYGHNMSSSRSTRRQQRSMPSPNICDISAPSFGSSGRGQTTNQCLEDMSMPSFGGVSGATNARSPRRQQMSMPSQNICDISAPSFGNSGNEVSFGRSATNECLEDMSMPSFGGVSGASRARSQRRQQRSMPSQNICDTSAPPSFQSTGRGPMPSFGGVSGSSRRQQTMPSECLNNVTQPSFGGASQYTTSSYFEGPGSPTMTNECLDDVTMPSFVGASSRQRTNFPSECLDDVTAPSYGRSMSSHRSTRRQQRSMPSQNICDISAPSFGSSGRRQTTNECLEDMSMPSFGGVSGATNARSPTRQQMSMPSQNICDISAPSFGNSGNEVSYGRSATNECLEDMSMPSFGRISGASRAKSQRRQQRSMPSQNICDTSAPPSYQSPGRRLMTSECLDDISMPSCPERSLSQGASRRRQQRSMPSQYICDVTEPSYYSSGRGPMTNECLDSGTMPSFGSRRNQTMPSECLDDITAPSFGQSQRTQQLWEISPPDFNSYNSYPHRPHSEPTYPSECLQEVTAPGMSMSMGSRSPHVTRAYLHEISTPSMRRARSFPCIPSQQHIGDISAPSMSDIFISIEGSRVTRRETSQNRSAGLQWADRANNSSMPCENLENISEPTYPNNSSRGLATSSSSRGRYRPGEQLEDESMPTLASTGRGHGKSQGQSQGQEQRYRNNFARSTAIGEDLASSMHELGVGKGQKDPPCQCPASKKGDTTNLETDSNGKQTLSTSKSSASLKKATSNENIEKRAVNGASASEQLSNECEPSALNDTMQGPSSGVTEVKEVTIIASVSSMTRKYTKKNANESKDNLERSRDRGKSVYHNIGNFENLNDVSMPTFESTGMDSSSPSNRNNTTTNFISNISEPTYGPSLQDSTYSNRSCNPENNQTFHGFSSMDNYAPFDQLINSTPQTGIGSGPRAGPCSSLRTPVPVRGNNRQKCTTSNTLRSDGTMEARTKCCCSTRNCQRNRKTRQTQKSQYRNDAS